MTNFLETNACLLYGPAIPLPDLSPRAVSAHVLQNTCPGMSIAASFIAKSWKLPKWISKLDILVQSSSAWHLTGNNMGDLTNVMCSKRNPHLRVTFIYDYIHI